MAYSFKHVTIYAFDIHPAVSFLKDPSRDYLQSNFEFLKSRDAYEHLYWSDQPVQTASFTFKGLSSNNLKKSHFWKSFGNISISNGRPDIWHLQMPFADKHVKTNLKLDYDIPGVSITVVPSVYLSALGWSVNLKMDLEGNIKKSLLIDFVGWLTSGEKSDFSFKIGSDLKTPKEVFRFFNNLIQEEVYKKENPPHPGMKIIRQLVISVNSYEGDITRYPEMPTDEKALMRSILFGRNIDPLVLAKEESNFPLTKTFITTSGTNFALTHFEQGTFIFLQREANNREPVNKAYKRKVACFAANCKHCLMISYLLWQFYTQSGNQVVETDLGKLKTTIPQTLKSLPENFSNLFCKNLFLQHKGIAGLLQV